MIRVDLSFNMGPLVLQRSSRATILPRERRSRLSLITFFPILLAFWLTTLPLYGREKDTTQYGAGLIVNLPMPEPDVVQAVKEIVQNGIIRGSKEYEREQYITGAAEANTARGFPEWQEGGKVFYKVRDHALDPRNFKESGDVGTLAVRYVVQAQGEKQTVLRIDAIFVEDFRHTVHPSNGSVEGAEYKDIHDHLEALEALKQEATEAAQHRSQVNDKLIAKGNSSSAFPVQPAITSTAPIPESTTPKPESRRSEETPEQHLKDLRRQVQRTVKPPGAPLKASPFRSASTLVSLPSGTEVLIVISTPYWYGVETHAGQHGWVAREDLELLP